jgi:ATP-dependent Clp protease ATP-binding subunit ClpC
LALIAHEGGATRYGLHFQGISPTRLQEGVVLHLRSRAKRQRSAVPPDREHLQAILQQILKQAGAIAACAHAGKVAEVHLLRALLETESPVRSLLEDEKVNVAQLRTTAERFETASDDEEEDVSAIADIETIRKRLQDRLVGQDFAIEQILPYVELMRFGFTDPDRPVGVFFFCGQSGSGKTEMAKELARAVYGSEENLIFLEMGQFNAPESMNIFVGAPPGYVGFGQGKLTNGLRDKPRAVVLFDEVEKAHPRVLDALLRFLDEGKIDDPAGSLRDGSQCVVILTSNVGAEKLSQLSTQIGDDPFQRTRVRKTLRAELKLQKFRVEFLNRVDEVLLFHTLTKKDYAEIAGRYLAKMKEKLEKDRQIHVALDPSVESAIGDYCSEISEGARAVRRLARAVVLLPASRFVLKNACKPPVHLKVKAVRESRPGGAAARRPGDGAEDAASEPVGVVEPAAS